MKQGEKNILLYISITTAWVLLLIIIGALLHNKSPENQKKTATEQKVDPLQPPSFNSEKPANTTSKDENRQASSTNTTYLPNKDQRDALAYNKQGDSYLKKGCLMIIVTIVMAIIVCYGIENYNWIWKNELDSPNSPHNTITPNIVEYFNNVYGCRTNYDNLFLSRSEEDDYYALLPINADTIGYGSAGYNSLSQVVHKLKALERDQKNKGLLITIQNEDEQDINILIGPCLTLIAAIEAYKQRTKRTVIAFGETFMPKSYCIATGADKIYIGEKGTIKMHVAVLIQLCALRNANNQPLNYKAQLNVVQQGDEFVCGKYKVTSCQNDVEDNFKKCYQDPYIQCIMKRKYSIQQQKSWYQNLFNNVVASATKVAVFVSNMPSSPAVLLKGITTTKACNMGLVDDYKQNQKKIIKELGDPVQECCLGFPFLTLKEKWALVQQPAIEVVFIQGCIGTRLLERIMPLLTLLEKAKQVKGIILVIDSLGGYATSSKSISSELAKLRENAGKCIFTYTEGYCCSAAYQIGCTAHKIFARETAYIGSIGVRTEMNKVNKYYNHHFIEQQSKDYLQRYGEDFIDHVAHYRAKSLNTSKEKWAQIARSTEARAFDGQRAKEIGLIDQIGTLDTTIATMKETLKYRNIKVFYRETPHED
ncbi:MAG: S49 family peptidase [Bacteroidota bacterium]